MCYFAEHLADAKYKLYAEVETRNYNSKSVVETVEIVQQEVIDHQKYMTAAKFLELSKKAEYDYVNDDTVIPY